MSIMRAFTCMCHIMQLSVETTPVAPEQPLPSWIWIIVGVVPGVVVLSIIVVVICVTCWAACKSRDKGK